MLNISRNSINTKVDISGYKAVKRVSQRSENRHFNNFFKGVFHYPYNNLVFTLDAKCNG